MTYTLEKETDVSCLKKKIPWDLHHMVQLKCGLMMPRARLVLLIQILVPMWTQIELKGADSPSIPVTRKSSADQANTKDQDPFTVATMKQDCCHTDWQWMILLTQTGNVWEWQHWCGCHWEKASRNSEIQEVPFEKCILWVRWLKIPLWTKTL